jgi:hypothetical protein
MEDSLGLVIRTDKPLRQVEVRFQRIGRLPEFFCLPVLVALMAEKPHPPQQPLFGNRPECRHPVKFAGEISRDIHGQPSTARPWNNMWITLFYRKWIPNKAATFVAIR